MQGAVLDKSENRRREKKMKIEPEDAWAEIAPDPTSGCDVREDKWLTVNPQTRGFSTNKGRHHLCDFLV